ncbi:MAG: hypothetical protein AB1Z38_03135 [Desulfotignum sp.]
MDQKQFFKQMIDFNRATFNNSFNTLVMLEDQTERLSTAILDQATWLPEEGRKAIKDWVDTYKKGREEFKKAVEDSYNKVDEYFSS